MPPNHGDHISFLSSSHISSYLHILPVTIFINLISRSDRIIFDFTICSFLTIVSTGELVSVLEIRHIVSYLIFQCASYLFYIFSVYLQCASIDVLIYRLNIYVTSDFPSSKTGE